MRWDLTHYLPKPHADYVCASSVNQLSNDGLARCSLGAELGGSLSSTGQGLGSTRDADVSRRFAYPTRVRRTVNEVSSALYRFKCFILSNSCDILAGAIGAADRRGQILAEIEPKAC